ncbi:MAG: flagellar biosynthesis regulator FlhF [Desulfobacca sp.]|nr:flagellar biosynthesis regulator FlhF [Desulfobacca sp.]
MTAMQMQAYRAVQKTAVSSGREIEAAALTNTAQRLIECQKRWDEEGHFQRLDEALRLNQKVWTVFQSEMVRADNPLPEDIKKNLLELSLFIDRQIIDTMCAPQSEKLDILINININLAAGLRNTVS